ncbi:MAG: STAS/SEC14 domain-containing protein [Proteobacteria bacterium]|nr:STAS/SEC14 domain-containing protein [Pseudomonadota bacterium]NOG61465.1 STAS/SEC14 domain-containing protein [Pseudomonadota bacterium]
MLSVKIDEVNGIAVLEPDGALSEDDFRTAVKEIDPFIERTGKLKGIIIHTKSFPGWDSFAALVSHFEFVKEHHKKISCVALCTDSVVGIFAETIASHFINAEIKLFSYDEFEDAKNWVANETDE